MDGGGLLAELSEQEKDALVQKFLPVINCTARRMAWNLPPALTVDDLVSAGMAGLVDALRRFEAGRAKLRTFAEIRIRGAIIDEIRSAQWGSRSARKKAKRLHEARRELQQRLGRRAEGGEVARYMGITSAEYYGALRDSGPAPSLSLDGTPGSTFSGDGPSLLECIADTSALDPLEVLEFEARRNALLGRLCGLPRRERLLVFLYYWEGLTMKEIGRVLGLTESRVCQLHGQCLRRLRAILSESR